ncbi:MAG: apolipoprotein N-acyltransferase, partial [Thermoleophilaceae bacterium]
MAISPGRSLAAGVALAALGGATLVLASPPYGLWPLVLVGFAPIVVAQHHVLPERWSGAALALGFG